MKKKLTYLVFLIAIMVLINSFVSKTPGNISVQQSIDKNLDSLSLSLSNFHQSIAENKLKDIEFIQNYKKCRQFYKKTEAYLSFRYPELEKEINGGPVPKVEVEEVFLIIDKPNGFQVLEELITAEDKDTGLIKAQIATVISAVNKCKHGIAQIPIEHWEILESNHQAITRLIALGLSGFDSPELNLRFSDAITVLNQLNTDLAHFIDKDKTAINKLVKESVKIISEAENSDNFNYYSLIRNQLIPLQVEIKKLHTLSDFELYEEITAMPRAIGSGKHLFDENYLNPMFSMRGQYDFPNLAQIELGRSLFYDPILSANQKMACASCHHNQKSFADGLAKSINNNGNEVLRNAPTLINAGFQSSFFWDLRSKDMNHQIMSVFENKEEFNTSNQQIIEKLSTMDAYKNMFALAFPNYTQPINSNTLKSALELYIRSLINTDAKFDKNIRGVQNDMTKDEVQGFNLFFGKAACATCHFVPHFNGWVPPHFKDTEGEILGTTKGANEDELDNDNGLYDLFKLNYPNATETKGMFKTPGLRNIALTAPYMHNGAFKTLNEVMDFYNHGGGLGKGLDIPQQTLSADSLNLNEQELSQIIKFLNCLTDTAGTQLKPFLLPTSTNQSFNQRKWGGE